MAPDILKLVSGRNLRRLHCARGILRSVVRASRKGLSETKSRAAWHRVLWKFRMEGAWKRAALDPATSAMSYCCRTRMQREKELSPRFCCRLRRVSDDSNVLLSLTRDKVAGKKEQGATACTVHFITTARNHLALSQA